MLTIYLLSTLSPPTIKEESEEIMEGISGREWVAYVVRDKNSILSIPLRDRGGQVLSRDSLNNSAK
jgi:hypothetical protein